MINSKLIQYTPEQVEQACEDVKLVYVSLSHDEWAGVHDVILVKHTAKCIWPKNTMSTRVEKIEIGSLYHNGVYCIKGDEWIVAETYFNRMQEDFQENINRLQGRIDGMQSAKEQKALADPDPETGRFSKLRNGSDVPKTKWHWNSRY